MDAPILARVAELADRYGVSMTEISLAWLLTKVTAPVVGATKLHHIEGAAKGVELALTPEECSYLEELYVPHPWWASWRRTLLRRRKKAMSGPPGIRRFEMNQDSGRLRCTHRMRGPSVKEKNLLLFCCLVDAGDGVEAAGERPYQMFCQDPCGPELAGRRNVCQPAYMHKSAGELFVCGIFSKGRPFFLRKAWKAVLRRIISL